MRDLELIMPQIRNLERKMVEEFLFIYKKQQELLRVIGIVEAQISAIQRQLGTKVLSFEKGEE